MLITTSRYTEKDIRDLAKAIAVVFSGEYVARGKKTIDSLVNESRKKGHARICVVMPEQIVFIKVNELGQWSWVEESLSLGKFDFSEGLCACRSLQGKDASKFAMLFDFEENENAEIDAKFENGNFVFETNSAYLKMEIEIKKETPRGKP